MHSVFREDNAAEKLRKIIKSIEKKRINEKGFIRVSFFLINLEADNWYCPKQTYTAHEQGKNFSNPGSRSQSN